MNPVVLVGAGGAEQAPGARVALDAETDQQDVLPPRQEPLHVREAPGVRLEFPGELRRDLGRGSTLLALSGEPSLDSSAQDATDERVTMTDPPQPLRQSMPNVIAAEHVPKVVVHDSISGQRRDGALRRNVRRGEGPVPNAVGALGRKEQAHRVLHRVHEIPHGAHLAGGG